MKLVNVLVSVRQLLQDSNSNPDLQRYSDDLLLGFANQTLKRIALLRPDLFSYIGEIPCTAGEVLQSAPSDSIRLMEILRVKDGGAIRETNRETMDQTYPEWAGDAATACVNWMRHPRNPNRFFIYPKAPVAQILIGEYAQTPPDYAVSDDILLLPEAFYPAVVDGTVFLAEAVDSEAVSSNRAEMFQKSLTGMLSASLESRTVTDKEDAGIDRKGQS